MNVTASSITDWNALLPVNHAATALGCSDQLLRNLVEGKDGRPKLPAQTVRGLGLCVVLRDAWWHIERNCNKKPRKFVSGPPPGVPVPVKAKQAVCIADSDDLLDLIYMVYGFLERMPVEVRGELQAWCDERFKEYLGWRDERNLEFGIVSDFVECNMQPLLPRVAELVAQNARKRSTSADVCEKSRESTASTTTR